MKLLSKKSADFFPHYVWNDKGAPETVSVVDELRDVKDALEKQTNKDLGLLNDEVFEKLENDTKRELLQAKELILKIGAGHASTTEKEKKVDKILIDIAGGEKDSEAYRALCDWLGVHGGRLGDEADFKGHDAKIFDGNEVTDNAKTDLAKVQKHLKSLESDSENSEQDENNSDDSETETEAEEQARLKKEAEDKQSADEAAEKAAKEQEKQENIRKVGIAHDELEGIMTQISDLIGSANSFMEDESLSKDEKSNVIKNAELLTNLQKEAKTAYSGTVGVIDAAQLSLLQENVASLKTALVGVDAEALVKEDLGVPDFPSVLEDWDHHMALFDYDASGKTVNLAVYDLLDDIPNISEKVSREDTNAVSLADEYTKSLKKSIDSWAKEAKLAKKNKKNPPIFPEDVKTFFETIPDGDAIEKRLNGLISASSGTDRQNYYAVLESEFGLHKKSADFFKEHMPSIKKQYVMLSESDASAREILLDAAREARSAGATDDDIDRYLSYIKKNNRADADPISFSEWLDQEGFGKLERGMMKIRGIFRKLFGSLDGMFGGGFFAGLAGGGMEAIDRLKGSADELKLPEDEVGKSYKALSAMESAELVEAWGGDMFDRANLKDNVLERRNLWKNNLDDAGRKAVWEKEKYSEYKISLTTKPFKDAGFDFLDLENGADAVLSPEDFGVFEAQVTGASKNEHVAALFDFSVDKKDKVNFETWETVSGLIADLDSKELKTSIDENGEMTFEFEGGEPPRDTLSEWNEEEINELTEKLEKWKDGKKESETDKKEKNPEEKKWSFKNAPEKTIQLIKDNPKTTGLGTGAIIGTFFGPGIGTAIGGGIGWAGGYVYEKWDDWFGDKKEPKGKMDIPSVVVNDEVTKPDENLIETTDN